MQYFLTYAKLSNQNKTEVFFAKNVKKKIKRFPE